MTAARFSEHWRTSHGDVAGRIPNLRRYVQNHAVFVDGQPVFPYPGFDACSELEFDDIESMDAGFASEHYQQAVRADEDAFVDKSRFCLVLADVRELTDVPAGDGQLKLLTLFRAHPAVQRPELVAVLEGAYAEAAATGRRHELLVALDEPRSGREAAACDALSIMWFADADEARARLYSDAGQAAALTLGGLAFGTERLLARPVTVV